MNNTSENDIILYSKRDGVAIITLNRPKALNALTKALSDGIVNCIRKAENDDSVKAIVLTGKGKAFCGNESIEIQT